MPKRLGDGWTDVGEETKEILDEVQHGCDKSSNSCSRPYSY